MTETESKIVEALRTMSAALADVYVLLWDSHESSDDRMRNLEKKRTAIVALLMSFPPSPPSSDDKEAATALPSTEKGVL